MENIRLRRAICEDAPALARIHLAARDSAAIPNLHDEADVIRFHTSLIATHDVIVAHDAHGEPLGYAAIAAGMLDQLYVAPASHRSGIGRALLIEARKHGPLELYCFAHNERALAFYASFGAEKISEDGGSNEERLPALRLRLP